MVKVRALGIGHGEHKTKSRQQHLAHAPAGQAVVDVSNEGAGGHEELVLAGVQQERVAHLWQGACWRGEGAAVA